MDIRKFSPWNWFRDEEKNQEHIPTIGNGGPMVFFPEAERFFASPLFADLGTRFNFDSRGDTFLKPKVDIASSHDEYEITVEVPGVKHDDLEVSLKENALIIKGKKERRVTDKKDGEIHCIERHYGSFQRMLTLPQDAEGDKCSASFEDGVLTLRLPRIAQIASSTKSIPIGSSSSR